MSLFRRKAAEVAPERVYTLQGRKAHLKLAGVVLCPTSPGPAGWQIGTPADAELPVCTYCLAALAEGTP